MFDEFIKHVLGEWQMISQAPVSFIVAVTVIGVGIFWTMQWGYGREISLLRQQVADYKDKLSGATPDQARAKIDQLEARVAKIEPRGLSDQQRQTIAETARVPSGAQYRLHITAEGGCPDCPGYAAQFDRALKAAGWGTVNGTVMGPGHRPAHGIGIVVADLTNLPRAATTLRSAFVAAKIDFELMRGGPIVPGTEVGLLITARP